MFACACCAKPYVRALTLVKPSWHLDTIQLANLEIYYTSPFASSTFVTFYNKSQVINTLSFVENWHIYIPSPIHRDI